MFLAILFSLVAGLPFCVILFAIMGLPLYMSVLYMAAGIAASLLVLRLLRRRNPHKRLKRYYALGALAGAGIGLVTNGLFALQFKFQLDAAVISALLGGVGAVLYAIMFAAFERPPKARLDRTEEARFVRKLRQVGRNREKS